MSKKAQSINKLIEIVSRLRDPKDGCPWDLTQTHHSLIPYVIEEAYEVADAIRNGNDTNLIEELGDLLFQIIIHSHIASEEGRFCLEDIIINICQKMIRRHPHVFENSTHKSSEYSPQDWEKIKASEKAFQKSKTPISDKLRRKIRTQHPITGAINISQKVAEQGFEWDSIDRVWEKVDEELNELKEAIRTKNSTDVQNELGDVFFTLINIGRWCSINVEEGIAGTNKRFLDRFSYLETKLGNRLTETSHYELSKLWENAKKKCNN
ncbi:nucleoside triphosphate pyrophosphohydrolase [Prochlorococcus sp. MIT 1300]|uniref:nucleoside triphosphate pyrophosphohydrolase n=1 Tax=Prochlorococcus sp. MIT 1300 TaxID=3096218 RepID=UPI002A7577D4|nr:nucleoside triphosphate pyrophosphohydrolase [Prochlorococcus sp. MIT 1300]